MTNSRARFASTPQTNGRCPEPRWLTATGTTAWTYELTKRLPKGSYVVIARATDTAGNVEKSFTKADGNLAALRVR